MRWFLLGTVAVALVVLTAPGAVLALLVDGRGPGLAVALAGLALSGQSVAIGPVLVASAPSRGPSHGRRWRVSVPVGVAAVGLALVLGGLWAVEGPGTALALTAAHAAVVTLVLLVMLRWARRVSATSPMDVPRDGDVDRLSPAALRRRLRRVALLAVGLGVLTALVAVVGLTAADRPSLETTVVGLGGAVVVAALVLAVGVAGPMFAAARRMNEVAHNHSRLGWRVAWAIQVGRTRKLSPEDHEVAVRWAHAAQPSLLLQIVFQLSTLAVVLCAQLVPLLLEPQVGLRLWLVLVIAGLLLLGAVLFPQQYVATRRFARTHPQPVVGA